MLIKIWGLNIKELKVKGGTIALYKMLSTYDVTVC